MSFDLSPEQERAKTAILNWYRSSDRKPWFFLDGPAGSGKSSITVSTTECIKGEIIYVAPTAKAALVMRKKGCPNPRTIHNLIYKPAGQTGNKEQIDLLRELRELTPGSEKSFSIKAKLKEQFKGEIEEIVKKQESALLDEQKKVGEGRLHALRKALATDLGNYRDLVSSNPIFDLNLESDIRKAQLLVIDEISMVGKDVMKDILSFDVPVLVQGDLAQLPPVGDTCYFKNIKPDFSLQEVHRQAKDSPIIYLATLARLGQTLPVGWHGNCLVTRESAQEEAMAADQILVGVHKTRWALTDTLRGLLGYHGNTPCVGEKLICKNNDRKKNIWNGEQFKCFSFTGGAQEYRIGIENEEKSLVVNAHKSYFNKDEPHPYWKAKAACLDWGFVITTNASQGSQWPFVWVKDESRKFSFPKQHLYTSITRASEKVVVRLKND